MKFENISLIQLITDNEFLKVLNEKILTNDDVKLLANKFEVSVSTIQRWKDGISKPMLGIQKLFIEKLRKD